MSVSGEQITPYLKLLHPLGEGGMGRLWVAEHQTLEIQVAVKLLNPKLAQDGQWLARFREEAHAVAKIDSAHVVRVFDYGTTPSGEPFIVMELLRGQDLLRHVERTRGLTLDEILQTVAQTCKALSRAHALGIVHRDLKPENIFLTTEGEELFVKLLDFGIAKHQRGHRAGATEDHSIFGTPPYMSPEQILNPGGVDHRADLWALAVVIYELLTGTCPFVGSTPAETCIKVRAGEFTPPSELRAGLPQAVDDWFKRALHRNIDARFWSADELLRELRQALQLPGQAAGQGLSLAPRTAPTIRLGGSAPTSAPAVELVPQRKAARLPTLLAGVAVVVVGLVSGFLVVKNAPWLSADSRKMHAVAGSAPVAAASTGAPGDASPSSAPNPPDPEPGLAEPDASAPLTARSVSPARPANRLVRTKDASYVPAAKSPSHSTTGQKPLKDRGF